MFSAIGCSNKTLTKVVCDETGMTRFFEWVMSTSRDPEEARKRYKLAKSIDWLSVWKGVNEDESNMTIYPGSPFSKKLDEVQETYIPTPPFQYALDLDLLEVPVTLQEAGITHQDCAALTDQIKEQIREAVPGSEWIKLSAFRKSVIDQLEEAYGKSLAVAVYGPSRFYADMKERGYVVGRTAEDRRRKATTNWEILCALS